MATRIIGYNKLGRGNKTMLDLLSLPIFWVYMFPIMVVITLVVTGLDKDEPSK